MGVNQTDSSYDHCCLVLTHKVTFKLFRLSEFKISRRTKITLLSNRVSQKSDRQCFKQRLLAFRGIHLSSKLLLPEVDNFKVNTVQNYTAN